MQPPSLEVQTNCTTEPDTFHARGEVINNLRRLNFPCKNKKGLKMVHQRCVRCFVCEEVLAFVLSLPIGRRNKNKTAKVSLLAASFRPVGLMDRPLASGEDGGRARGSKPTHRLSDEFMFFGIFRCANYPHACRCLFLVLLAAFRRLLFPGEALCCTTVYDLRNACHTP